MSELWTIGRKDMRTWSPFAEDVELFAHFIYEPNPPGFDKDDPSTWGRRWRIIGPADGSEDDPQNVAESLVDAINAELARLRAQLDDSQQTVQVLSQTLEQREAQLDEARVSLSLCALIVVLSVACAAILIPGIERWLLEVLA